MGTVIHVASHFLLGAALAHVLGSKYVGTMRERALLLLFGGISAVSPDMTKFFGDILGHSIWFAPVFGLLFSLGFRAVHKDFPFLKSFGLFTATVLSHIFIDYIGNGVAPFYPFIREETALNLIRPDDFFPILILAAVVLTALVHRKGRLLALTGVLITGLYFGGLGVSKYQLEKALTEQYRDDGINLLITYRNISFLEWGFMVRTDRQWVSGFSPMLSREIHIETERDAP